MEKKTGECVIETLESFAEARPHSPRVGGFKVQSQPKRSLIENHWRSWKNKDVCIFGRRGGLMINNWCTGYEKASKRCFKRYRLGPLAARGGGELRSVGSSAEQEPGAGACDDEALPSWVKPFQSRAVCSHQSLTALSRARLHFSVLIT